MIPMTMECQILGSTLNGFNPYDPSDALEDIDNNGVMNIQEYQDSINPAQNLSPSEFLERLKENWVYLLGFIILFIITVFLACYGIRRQKRKNFHIPLPFISVIFFTCIALFLSIWNILYDEQWFEYIIVLHGILIVITVLFLVSKERKKICVIKNIKEFEKSFGGEHHPFKCPSCGDIFAIKITKYNNKQQFSLTCPDCGSKGFIRVTPSRNIENFFYENQSPLHTINGVVSPQGEENA